MRTRVTVMETVEGHAVNSASETEKSMVKVYSVSLTPIYASNDVGAVNKADELSPLFKVRKGRMSEGGNSS